MLNKTKLENKEQGKTQQETSRDKTHKGTHSKNHNKSIALELVGNVNHGGSVGGRWEC